MKSIGHFTNKKPRFNNRGFFATPTSQAVLPRPAYFLKRSLIEGSAIKTFENSKPMVKSTTNKRINHEINKLAFTQQPDAQLSAGLENEFVQQVAAPFISPFQKIFSS